MPKASTFHILPPPTKKWGTSAFITTVDELPYAFNISCFLTA